jgi:rubrerythrin
MQLTQKETSLLKDLKGQEKLCVDKYTNHASCAVDPQLKDMFSQIAQTEQQHLDTITQMEGGTVPTPGGGSQSQPTFKATYGAAETQDKQADSYLCTDVLTTEKHASHLYDTCIFEFKDESARNALNHIQKEEQEHGKMIYDYMAANAMYS